MFLSPWYTLTHIGHLVISLGSGEELAVTSPTLGGKAQLQELLGWEPSWAGVGLGAQLP